MPPWTYRYFWQWHQAAFCQGWSHVRSLCSFGSTLSGVWWTPFWRLLKHTQLEHEMWRFPKIHLWGKSPCDFINSIEIPIKKNICTTHQTSVSVALNAFRLFKSELLPRVFGFQTWICIFSKEKISGTERHEWLHRKAAAAKMLIFRWFYRYFLTASFEASQGTVPKSCSASKT